MRRTHRNVPTCAHHRFSVEPLRWSAPDLQVPLGTPEDDHRLMAMVEAGVDKAMVARKLKRTVAAIISRLTR